MPGIQDSGYPHVFRVPNKVCDPPILLSGEQAFGLRTYVRALEGMQKEALVTLGTPGGETHIWRMVSDEGPYLNGTDLAPFPLAFFSAGMQFSFLSELVRHARARDVTLKSVRISQDNRYSMDGSALQGTMIGGAFPVNLEVHIESDASPEVIKQIVSEAERTSPAHVLMRNTLANTFALTFNGAVTPVTEVDGSPTPYFDDPDERFANAMPDPAARFLEGAVTKVAEAEKVHGVDGGVASSLQANQKRTLHVHGDAKLLDNMLMETTIQLFKPIGSSFRFVSDEVSDVGGTETAPPPLAYLSAGVGFCYMTQLGRYAHITKQDLKSYKIIQDNFFMVNEGGDVASSPFDTHVMLEAGESQEVAQKTVSMSERTCFLHAAMRTSAPTEISLTLNDQPLIPAS